MRSCRHRCHNAGIDDVGPAVDESVELFQSVVTLNLVAPFVVASQLRAGCCARAFGIDREHRVDPRRRRYRQRARGRVCRIQGGLVNLTRELAAQWAADGIRVNALAPGFFPTDLTTDMFDTERGAAYLRRRTPMRRGGEPHELDGALLFLASDASSYVTGQVVVVDGGWTAI